MKYPLKGSGYIEAPFDPRDLFEDELLGGEGESLPPAHYRVDSFKFEPQGSYPFCVSFSVAALAEQLLKAKKANYEFSQEHLFFHSGGTQKGSNFRANLETAKGKGCIGYSVCPMPDNIWEWDDAKFASEKAETLDIPFTGAKKIPGYVRVLSNPLALKTAIMRYGGLLVGVAASGGYWGDKAKRPAGKPDNHAVVLAGWDEDGSWWVFDSLQPKTDFDGYHRLHSSYEFGSAYALTELPDNWKEIRDTARLPPPGNAERYGKPRDFAAEVKFANEMLVAFKKFNNQSVLEAAGRFWGVLTRAGVYGSYNLSYYKWGMWYPGDIVNDIFHWTRTGKHIFNFDKPRDQQ